MNSHFRISLKSFQFVSVLAAASLVFSLPLSAALPVEVAGPDLGGVRAVANGDRLYVSGSAKTPMGNHAASPAHVEIRLVDARGQVIAEKKARLDIRHPKTSAGKMRKTTYVASFPLSDAERASKVVVMHCSARHES